MKAALYVAEMTLAKRIKRARMKRGLSQKQVGEAFGISSQAVSQWETDDAKKNRKPDLEKIPCLAELLNVPVLWLLAGTGDPPENDLASLWERLTAAQRRQAKRLLEAMAEDSQEVA